MQNASEQGRPYIPSLANFSPLQTSRLQYVPTVPTALRSPKHTTVTAVPDVHEGGTPTTPDEVVAAFPSTHGAAPVRLACDGATAAPSGAPLRVGIVFCGRQCPGANNVVTGAWRCWWTGARAPPFCSFPHAHPPPSPLFAGLYDYLQALNPNHALLGFASGTEGLYAGNAIPLDAAGLALYRNQGGFHLLGRSVDMIRSPAQRAAAAATVTALKLDGLVLLGGTFTNTDAAHLAESFAAGGVPTTVIAVPATIDGDMRGGVETTLGFDTATKVYSQLVGTMGTDGNSAKKYWCWLRLMGRATSHIALEVALQTRPNLVLLGEDLEARRLTLTDIVHHCADVIAARAAAGKNFGVVLLPEGILAYIPELRSLIDEMNALFVAGVPQAAIPDRLTPWSRAVLAYLPPLIRDQLFLERESSGALQLSQVSTERLLAELTGDELARRKAAGTYKGKYATITHFFGYQARSSLPSNFDCAYGTALGATSAALVVAKRNGYMATVRGLAGPVEEWTPMGVPLVGELSLPPPGKVLRALSIESAPVDLQGAAMFAMKRVASKWQRGEAYTNPGPIQFDGPVAGAITATLSLEQTQASGRVAQIRRMLTEVRDAVSPSEGVTDEAIETARAGLVGLLRCIKGSTGNLSGLASGKPSSASLAGLTM